MEPTPAAFVARVVEVFREVRRVLRDDGTCWVNLGDSYNTRNGSATNPGLSQKGRRGIPLYESGQGRLKVKGLKDKDMCGIPWRVAFALQDDGWYLRSDIVWSKPNPMPESVTDRPTRAHEYIFLLSKRAKYYYDAEAIREPAKEDGGRNWKAPDGWDTSTGEGAHGSVHRLGREKGRAAYRQRGHGRRHAGFNDRWDAMSKDEQQALGANKRTVWTVATHPFAEAHFATFPPKLIEPCILAGTSPQACEHCCAPWRRVVEAVGGTIGKSWHDHQSDLGDGLSQVHISVGNFGKEHGYQRIEHGWQPTCRCKDNTGSGRSLVLDPFMGSGTVALVATQWQRDYLGIELNAAYIEMAERRLDSVQVKLFAS